MINVTMISKECKGFWEYFELQLELMYFLPYDISKFSILSKRHLKYRSMKMPSDSHQQQPYGVILCPIYGIGFSIVNWRRITCSNSWRLNFTVSLSSIGNTSIAVYTCYLVHILSKYICKLQSHQQKAFMTQ